MSYVEDTKRHALLPMEEKHLAVETQAKEGTEQLNNEIRELRSNVSELNRLSDLEDHIDFLQVTDDFFCVNIANWVWDMVCD